MGWVTPHAPTRAELAACVQCGLCLPYCPTFRLTGDEAASPRGRLMAMAAVQDGVATIDATFEEMMGFCLQCRACEAVCPGLVPFGRAMEGARAEVAAQRPNTARRVRHGALRLLGSRPAVKLATLGAAAAQRLGGGRWLPTRLARGLAGLRRLPLRQVTVRGGNWSAFGEQRGVVALLAGCVMDPWFTDVHVATIEVLRRAGYRVAVPEGQTCCGALAAHDGDVEQAESLAARNAMAFAGCDLIVTNSAGCGAHLKMLPPRMRGEYPERSEGGGGQVQELRSRHGGAFPPVRDVTEVVAAAIADGRLPTLPPAGTPVAIQDPCHLRHAQRITAEPRAILRAAGYEVRETDRAGLCCGAAGVYSLLRPGTSLELGERKAAQVRATGATVVASANPGCEMQLRAHLGQGYRVAHPVELYAEALRASRGGP